MQERDSLLPTYLRVGQLSDEPVAKGLLLASHMGLGNLQLGQFDEFGDLDVGEAFLAYPLQFVMLPQLNCAGARREGEPADDRVTLRIGCLYSYLQALSTLGGV